MISNMDYYLKRGFDEKTARYYISGRRKITHAEAADDFNIILEFDNGERRIYDCKPLLKDSSVFSVLSSEEKFRQLYLDENHAVSWDIDPCIDSTVHWNNKLDLSPDSCYIDSVPV